jgi:transposase-like protein
VDQEALWRSFPSTATEFEAMFPDEEACRRYLIEVRWGGQPQCGKCGHDDTWELSNGRFECRRCGHQTSVTAGTVLHKTRKPLRMWFRAIWEMSVRKNGISAKELQRILGFGSYETAWTWMHKLRRCTRRKARDQLEDDVQVDETYIGSRSLIRGRGTSKALILVAVESQGRVRLEHGTSLKEGDIGDFIRRNVDPTAIVTTDSLGSYSERTVAPRSHNRINLTKLNLKVSDPLHRCHRVANLLKRWLLGTYHGAASRKHLNAYLDEYAFRFNRRKTRGVGRIAARLIEQVITVPPITYRTIVISPVRPQSGRA